MRVPRPGRATRLLPALLLAAAVPALRAAEELAVTFEYPSFDGDFYASGQVSFPPGLVPSEDHILVLGSGAGAEVLTRVTAQRRWPDGSVLKASILFPANAARPDRYRVVFGADARRTRRFAEPAVLPSVAFSVSGAPRAAEAMDLNVGDINVRVDRSPAYAYTWHLAPLALILALTAIRSRRTNPSRAR